MGTPYTSKSQSGYNISPPPDDGSAVAANICKWSDVKTKLGDPTLTLAQAINTALVSALDFTGRVTGVADTPTAADHMRTVECNAALAITLPDAATIGAGFTVGYKNTSAGVVSVALLTAANTLDGVANGSTRIAPGGWAAFKVNTAANGYYGFGVNSHVGDSYYPIFVGEAGGTADALTATVETPLKALYEGMLITLDATATSLTTTPTLNLTLGATATGAKTITNPNGGALIAGDILGLHHRLILGYESVLGVWKLLNPGLPLSQAAGDLRYTPIAYSQYGGNIAVNTNVAAADSGKWFLISASAVATLPSAPATFKRYLFTGVPASGGVIAASGTDYLVFPDGSTSALGGSYVLGGDDSVDISNQGGSNYWFIFNTSGKTIIKDATAANQAASYNQVPGLGQTWQNVTASRAWATNYTNTTAKAITVAITFTTSAVLQTPTISVGGVVIGAPGNFGNTNGSFCFTFLVQPGAVYRIDQATGTPGFAYWSELR